MRQKNNKKDLSESRESFSAIFVLGQAHLRQSDLKTAKMAEKYKMYDENSTTSIISLHLIGIPYFYSTPTGSRSTKRRRCKGTAHIGALKVIEEAGVPIDMIVGTSMGSIIGGLYAIGYTTEQLDSIFMAQDWNTLLSDKAYRNALNLQTREQNSQYILSVPFFEKPQDLISGGVIKGRNIGRMLWQLTEGYHDSIDFQKMPIPFACISQDLVTGEEIVFRNGVLPIAIRASMSIPGAFAPISMNGKLLIDGGIINNYPVDVARQMGADIVIGVDVQDPMKMQKNFKTISSHNSTNSSTCKEKTVGNKISRFRTSISRSM